MKVASHALCAWSGEGGYAGVGYAWPKAHIPLNASDRAVVAGPLNRNVKALVNSAAGLGDLTPLSDAPKGGEFKASPFAWGYLLHIHWR
jgi:hypothetical protein